MEKYFKIRKKANLLKPKSRKSKSRLMKEKRRRKMKKMFLPLKQGDNKIHMTVSCRRLLNTWKRGNPEAFKNRRFARIRRSKIKQLDRELIKQKGE